ncbi:MAG: 5-nucleotidase, lipoprotein e(P4) family [Chitinophagaceae bacterium]|nr:5-nucleotidase, lipoprotein e(P4) family [Chitinophagaceae bacterium]
MKKCKSGLVVLIGLSCMINMACRVQKVSSVSHSQNSWVVHGPLWGAVWQQKASEYKALCYQAYNIARLRLDWILQQPHSKPLAIVTDIDETALDNSPYAVHQALNDSSYSDRSWMEWTARVECDTVPGALSFFKYASSKGVRIFYITNRLEAERQATEKDLQRWNFPDATPDHLFLKQATSGKEQRRGIVAQNHEIVLLCGDNLSDFSAIFDKQPYSTRDSLTRNNASSFGERFIVLPNSTYGDWEAALYNFNYRLDAAQKDSLIKQQLRTY